MNEVSDLLFSEKVEQLEKKLMKLEQAPCPVEHFFGPGIYIRQVSIPAGTFSIGHHQNFEHNNIMIKGKVTMKNDNGEVVTLEAPFKYVGKPGRKIGYIHEDMVWLNVYATDETDVNKLEAHFLTKSDSWKESAVDLKAIKQISYVSDKDDFLKAISELGFSEEEVKRVSENEDDMVQMPHGSYKFKVDNSDIHGFGIFAAGDFEVNEIIGPARIGEKRTSLGRFTNHAKDPNAKMVLGSDGHIFLVATKKINGCFGGINGEEITIDYRESVKLTKLIGGV